MTGDLSSSWTVHMEKKMILSQKGVTFLTTWYTAISQQDDQEDTPLSLQLNSQIWKERKGYYNNDKIRLVHFFCFLVLQSEICLILNFKNRLSLQKISRRFFFFFFLIDLWNKTINAFTFCMDSGFCIGNDLTSAEFTLLLCNHNQWPWIFICIEYMNRIE